MTSDLVLMAVLAGAANWAFRVLPILLMKGDPPTEGLLSRFLAATGPAAIATLFAASALPQLWPAPHDLIPLAAGTAATVLAFLPRRSVAMATLAGAAAYGLAFALLA